jgi:hypothetical protein
MTAATVLYPHTYGAWNGCLVCFQPRGDVATTRDPRDGELVVMCRACHRAIEAGHPIVLPTGEVLADTWERLARLRQNNEITDETITTAVETLAPELTPEQAADAVLQLTEALLRLQYINGDTFDPADGDQEYLDGEADRDRKNALAKLMVGAPS